jgi:superfamily II DNA/RNA helicase
MKTILLRRVGSTIHAGRQTARKMLGLEERDEDDEDDDSVEDPAGPPSSLYPLQTNEREALERFLQRLENAHEPDPKAKAVEEVLLVGVEGTAPWLEQGCIVFSQYYDSVLWLARYLSARRPEAPIAVYAGAARSGLLEGGRFSRCSRESIKARVQSGEVRLLIGTDAASEGLNLQRLGTLINLDLPWNPTRLEQRKGRIQRIGQARDEVFVYNMRYRGSVEDRVHELLSSRLKTIRDLFGQLPDTLEDVWVAVALRDEEKAREIIDAVPESHPFEMRYDRVEPVDWESCARVLDSESQLEALRRGW